MSEKISTRRTAECLIDPFFPAFMRVLVAFQSAITTVFAVHHSTRPQTTILKLLVQKA